MMIADDMGDRERMGDSLEYRRLEPGEGAKLVACIRRCYGESHVDPALYVAAAIDDDLATGRRHSAVALTPSGQVVGHLGLVIRRPGDITADAGLTMVDPGLRGRGIAYKLAIELGRIAIQLELVGLHDYPVTVHGGTQRLATDLALGVGLLLDNMPADVEFNAMSSSASAAATPSLVRYMGLRPAPEREVHWVEPYAELARSVYARGPLPRNVRVGGATDTTSGRGGELHVDVDSDDRRGVVKLTLRSPGGSMGDLERTIEAHAGRSGPTQIDLPLSDPRTPGVVMGLRRLGFFFGALLPEFHQGDVLRMQRLARRICEGEAPVLESQDLRVVAEFVERDAAAVSSAGPIPAPN
jgi:serine/threonine-protein kinase RsbW